MKRIISALLILSFAMSVNAQQITVEEPEFGEQTLFLKSDSEGVLLPREKAMIKTRIGASLYLTGIGKIKTRITLPEEDSSVLLKQRSVYRFILKAEDNKTDPNSFITIFKFQVKGDKRQALIGEVETFTGVSDNMLNNISYQAKRYGESSYLISIDNLKPGEYGILIGDPNNLTAKKAFMITTFGIADAEGNAPSSPSQEDWKGADGTD